MTMNSEMFLSDIHRRLVPLTAGEKEEIMSELSAHLEDKADALRAQGQSDPTAAAQASFGNPADVAARLTDVHTRPTRQDILLAIAPFLMNGVLVPLLALAVAAIDRALAPATRAGTPLLAMRLHHAESTAVFLAFVLIVLGLLALGALIGLQRGLPLWSASWLGSTALGLFFFLQAVFDEASPVANTVAGVAFAALLFGALSLIARRRGGVLALLIALSFLLQIRIFVTYALAEYPLTIPVLRLVFTVGMVVLACLAVYVLSTWRSGHLALAVAFALLALAPGVAPAAAGGFAGFDPLAVLGQYAAPFILFLPYLFAHRPPDAAAR